MRICNTQSWSNDGLSRNLDCPEPSNWKVSFESGEVSGYPCDEHVADYLDFTGRSIVDVIKVDMDAP